MRIALVLVSLLLLLTLGAFGLFLGVGPRPEPHGPTAASSSSAAMAEAEPAADPARDTGEILARMDALSREIDDLRALVSELRAGAAREPVAVEASKEPVDPTTSEVAAVQRNAILRVIEEDRKEQERKREEEQRARDMQTMLARAERTARRFGLTVDQQKSLADVYILERQKMEDLRTRMREQSGLGGDPESFREGFRELREWRLNELTTRLGPDLAQQINDSEYDRIRGQGVGGGGRRGDRGQGGDADGNSPPGGGF